MIKPENYDEIEACIALIWGPSGDHLQTKGELREACEKVIVEMRQPLLQEPCTGCVTVCPPCRTPGMRPAIRPENVKAG